MKLSDIDKEAILNPIINELGIIDPTVKEKIVRQVSAQIDRLIVKHYGDALKSIDNFYSDINTKIQKSRVEMRQVTARLTNIETVLQDDNKRNKEVLIKIAKLFQKVSLKIDDINLDPALIATQRETNKSNRMVETLSKISFSELISLANKKGIKITPRIKREEIVKQILDKENSDGQKK